MKVVITARNFNIEGCYAIEALRNAGLEVVDYGDVIFNSTAERADAIGDADIVIAAVEDMKADLLEKCPNLKMISRRGIGYDSIDIDYCKQNNIKVARALGTVEGAVSEHVMAYIMYFARRIDLQNAYMQGKQWTRVMTGGAKSSTLGLIGFGGIGKEIAKRAVPFGMNVVYYCRHPQLEWEREYGVKYADLDELLSISDYVSVNTPLTDETRGMINAQAFDKMKKGSVLINIARSAIVNVDELKDAVLAGKIKGAAIDVFENEPCTDSVLLGLENVVLTPHTAPYTQENFILMNNLAAQNAIDFTNGELKEKYTVI